MKKDLCAIFNQFGLKITIEANMKIINVLDVTLNLSTGKYQPYSKPNNVPLYVNNKSNHPPNILRNIPLSINKRLSQISSDKNSFNNTSAEYQGAIDSSGYNHKLQFDHPSLSTPASKPKSRKRKITRYNPPFSKNVKTNIGQSFLKIIDEEFPTSNPLHKIFNRNTLKISYCCMPNIKQTLDGHNKGILSKSVKPNTTAITCNCRKANELNVPYRKNAQLNPLYIKPQSRPPALIPPKHTLDLLKTLLKLDTLTIRPLLRSTTREMPRS